MKDKYVLYYNCCRIPAPELKPSDLVWIDNSNIQTTCLSRKLDHHNLGPYPIERRIGHGAYCIKLPRHLHPVFPIVKLYPTAVDPIPSR